MGRYVTDPKGRRVRVHSTPMPQVPEGTQESMYRSVGMTQKSLEREVRRELKHGRLTAEGATKIMGRAKDWPVK